MWRSMAVMRLICCLASCETVRLRLLGELLARSSWLQSVFLRDYLFEQAILVGSVNDSSPEVFVVGFAYAKVFFIKEFVFFYLAAPSAHHEVDEQLTLGWHIDFLQRLDELHYWFFCFH